MTVGQRIRMRREELNLTQDELAKKVGYKSRSSINKIETSRELPLRKVEKMAIALDTSPSYLMGWVNIPDPSYPKTKLGMIEEEIAKSEIYPDIIAAKNYLDDIVKSALDEFERAGGSKEELAKAIRLYTKLKTASPEIQTAIETLLKAK